MSKEPRFSVVIPAHNAAHFILRAVRSVLEQTFHAHEIIVVDDGSSDDTASIVWGLGAKVTLLRQDNLGVSAARNAGVETASSDWVAFLDADDWYLPHRLEWHRQFIAREPDVDFLTGDFEYRRETGELVGRSMERSELGRRLMAGADADGFVTMLRPDFPRFIHRHFGDTHTLSLPRRTFLELGGYPAGFSVCEDVHFLARLTAVSRRVGVMCRPMAVYFLHNRSATRSDHLEAQRQTVGALEALRGALGDAPLEEGLQCAIRDARMDLSYALLRTGEKWEAVKQVLPLLARRPGKQSLRDVASIVSGMPAEQGAHSE